MAKSQQPEEPQPLGHLEAGRRIEATIPEAVAEGWVRWEEDEDKGEAKNRKPSTTEGVVS